MVIQSSKKIELLLLEKSNKRVNLSHLVSNPTSSFPAKQGVHLEDKSAGRLSSKAKELRPDGYPPDIPGRAQVSVL